MRRLPLGVMLLCAACGGGGDISDPPIDGAAGDGPSATGRWAGAPALAAGPRQETGVAVIEGRIYVVGGLESSRTIVTEVEALDVASMTWETVSSLPAPMHHPNVAAVEGRLYVIGSLGRDDFAENGEVWEYDATARTWTRRTPMPLGTARGASGVAVLGSKIYVAGGLRGLQAVNDFSAYDTTNDTWETLPSLPTSRDHLVAGAIGGRVYVIGGRNGGLEVHTGRVDIFDPVTGSWSRGSPMPTSRAGSAAAVLDDRLYVFGGEGNPALSTGVFDDVESYDPATDSWSIHVPMPAPRHGSGAAALMGRIYVLGGANKDGFASVDTVQTFTP